MKSKEFFGKFLSRYLWGNLIAMGIVVVLLCIGVKYGLDVYTKHGEAVVVPQLNGMDSEKAKELLVRNGLKVIVSDSGYNKRMPAGCVLMQTPNAGMRVKMGRTIFLTINSPNSPTATIPDLIDNSSAREAEAKLKARGFKMLSPRMVEGEKDWVYGITANGSILRCGDKLPVGTALTLMVGNGSYSDAEDVDIDYSEPDMDDSTGDVDDFQAVDGNGMEVIVE